VKEPKLDITRSIGEYLVERRTFLGKAGAASLGAVLTALGAPEAAGAFGSVPPPTSYSTLLGLCTPGSGTATNTPGITNTLQAIHTVGTVTYSQCAVAQNKVVTDFTYSSNFIASCSSITDMSGTGVIHYSNGQMSNYTIDSWKATRLLGQVVGVASGLITSGPLNGARIWTFDTRTVTDPSICASANGVTSSTGTTTLIIAQ